MENYIINLINNPQSFGNFNSILFFELEDKNVNEIYEDISQDFVPDEINCSILNLDNFEVEFCRHIPKFNESNSIFKIIFEKKKEKIILECYKGKITIENLFYIDWLSSSEGYMVIKKYFNYFKCSKLILGYELSLDIVSFDNSITETINDDSQYPIIFIDNCTKTTRENKYFLNDCSDLAFKKNKGINDYLYLLGI